MDFELNEDQRILQKSARDFLKKECPKQLVRELNAGRTGHSPELWSKMAGLGWTGILIPEQYGGIGWTFVDLAVLLEEMGYNLCPGPFVATTILGAMPILLAGGEDQKNDHLARVAAGELILTMAWAGPDGVPDLDGTSLTAGPHGDQWQLNGTRFFVPDAPAADAFVCPAGTGPSGVDDGGLTLFMVPADSPGVSITPLETISGEKQGLISFEDVSLPATAVIGPVGRARPVVRRVLNMAAVARSAETVGSMHAVLDMSVAYAKERVQFGRPIGAYQAIQHYLADMWVDVQSARNLVMKAAWALDEDQGVDKSVSMAKALAGRLGRRVTTVGHRIFGAIGYTMEHDLHLFHRRAVAGDLAFGDSDFHYERVAEGLGL
jgi:alkylation response protein AidB-like acyl-CoA dehydrogenase